MAKLSRLLEAFSGFVEIWVAEKASGSAAGAYTPNANITVFTKQQSSTDFRASVLCRDFSAVV